MLKIVLCIALIMSTPALAAETYDDVAAEVRRTKPASAVAPQIQQKKNGALETAQTLWDLRRQAARMPVALCAFEGPGGLSVRELARLGIVGAEKEWNEYLAATFPGTQFNCAKRSGKIVLAGAHDLFYDQGRIRQYQQTAGPIRQTIDFGAGESYTVQVLYGAQSVTFACVLAKLPCKYTDVSLSTLSHSERQGAQSTDKTDPDTVRTQEVFRNALIAAVNEIYTREFVHQGNMFAFARALLEREDLRDYVMERAVEEVKRNANGL